METAEIRVAGACIFMGVGSSPPDMNDSALRQKCLGHGIADAAASSDHQHARAVEFEFVAHVQPMPGTVS